MAGFRRVFTSFPGLTVLGEIEGINVIDIAPPSTPLGAGIGVVAVVGEFESGALNTPTRVFGGTDLASTFGGLGFAKDGAQHQGPVAQQSAGSFQPWEGNAFIHLRNKRYAGLIVSRVDNSAGSVTFNRLACVTGGKAPFDLEPAETITLDVDGGGATAATFDAARALRAGDGFNGDASQVWQVDDDGGPGFVDQTTEFNDATSANVTPFPAAEAVNDYFAVGRTSGPFSQIIFDYAGGTAGVGGVVVWEYWDGTAWSALAGVSDATAGFTTAVADGLVVSWTVPSDWEALSLNSVTAFYVRARITTVYGTNPVLDQGYVQADNVTGFLGGETLEIKLDGGPTQIITFTAAEQTRVQVEAFINSQTATDIAIVNGMQVDLRSVQRGTGGSIEVVGGTGAANIGHIAGTSTGSGDVADIDAVTQAEVKAVVEADVAGTVVDTDPDGNLRICADATPGTGTLEVTAVTATGLGVAVQGPVSAATSTEAKTIPAGTRVRDTTNTVDWVTLEDVTVPTTSGGPFTAKVRPYLDTDSAPTAAVDTIVSVVDTLTDGYSVTNPSAVSRLGSAAMDTRYLDAFNATIDVSGVSHDINMITCARHTTNTLRFGHDNALDATANGHRARKFVTAPPVGTTRTDAKASSGVGVGTNRSQRVFYLFPGVTTFVPEIARVGAAAGGVGFTDDGVIDTPSDAFYASVRSLLPPEENAGQRLDDTTAGAVNALTLESAYDPEQSGVGLTLTDYKDFKANGIIAPRADRVAGLVFQSDVTSVDPAVDSALADAKRRFMGDFIIDSLFDISSNFVKKLNTPSRRRAFLSTINSFLELLKAPNQEALSRIEDYLVADDTTDDQRALGFQLVTVKVRLYASMDFIVITTEVGTTVTVEEVT